MEQIFENINCVLADWNPIGVPATISIDEYRGYIPSILKNLENREELFKYLENVLMYDMGIGYDPLNKEDKADLRNVCDKISQCL
jgi:uncharacterized protein YbgA (DUF1722 family)